ncbi:MAG: AAA family ATPase [Agathobacter sp.]
MGKQTIISISREYGSGGHEIARKIAQELGFKFYDRSLLDEIATEKNMDVSVLQKYDEKPRNVILSRRVAGHTNSPEEIIAEFQFDFIRKKAEEGESFVIVGRCAETVLKDFDGLISIFITGERQHKIKRVMDYFGISENEAILKMARHDRKRKQYHNRHSDAKWGDSRLYDLCINSSPLGIDGTIRVLENYIRERLGKTESK